MPGRLNSLIDNDMEGSVAMEIDITGIQNQDVVLWDNTVTRLRRFWEEGPLVLVFLRHYG